MRFVLLLVLLCSGCMPAVQHGPWVRPGLSGAIGGSAGVAGDVDAAGELQPFFSFDGGMHLGITPEDSTYRGASVGLHLPLISLFANAFNETDAAFGFARFINIDAYVTGPQAKELRTAGGLTVSRFHTMPYLQIGKLDDWYGTLAAMFIRDSGVVIVAPSFTDVRRSGNQTVSHLTFTAGIGS